LTETVNVPHPKSNCLTMFAFCGIQIRFFLRYIGGPPRCRLPRQIIQRILLSLSGDGVHSERRR
jgi:hypothetical protein